MSEYPNQTNPSCCRADRREVRLARIALTPMLQAEEDRRCVCFCLRAHEMFTHAVPRYVEEMARFTEREAQVMKDVRWHGDVDGHMHSQCTGPWVEGW